MELSADEIGQEKIMVAEGHLSRSEESGRIEYSVFVSGQIDKGIAEAIRLSSEANEEIDFLCDSGDFKVTVSKDSSAESVMEQYDAYIEAARKAYDESPDGQREKESRAAKIIENQTKVDTLMDGLSDALEAGEAETVRWIGEIATLSDATVSYNAQDIIDALEGAGFELLKPTSTPPNGSTESVQALASGTLRGLYDDGRISQVAAAQAEKYVEEFGQSPDPALSRVDDSDVMISGVKDAGKPI